MKLRLGYPTLPEDFAAIHAVRRRIGDAVALDGRLQPGARPLHEALKRGHALDGEDIDWIEEPIRHDDYAGCATLARALKTPVQIGENFTAPSAMEAALAAGPATT